MTARDYELFDLGAVRLQRGGTLPSTFLAYKTYGSLAADKSNVILYPTSYAAHHTDIDWLIGSGPGARSQPILHRHRQSAR